MEKIITANGYGSPKYWKPGDTIVELPCFTADGKEFMDSGEYQGEMVWQWLIANSNFDREWTDIGEFLTKQFGTFENFLAHKKSAKTQKRAVFRIHPEAKPVEGQEGKTEIQVIDLSEFSINLQDVERAFCFGYLSNPDNNCLDNVEMMRRWGIFKNEYLEPRYGR